MRTFWTACLLLAATALPGRAQSPPALPERCVEVMLAVDGMV